MFWIMLNLFWFVSLQGSRFIKLFHVFSFNHNYKQVGLVKKSKEGPWTQNPTLNRLN